MTVTGDAPGRWIPCSEEVFDSWAGPVKMIESRFHRWITFAEELAEMNERIEELAEDLKELGEVTKRTADRLQGFFDAHPETWDGS